MEFFLNNKDLTRIPISKIVDGCTALDVSENRILTIPPEINKFKNLETLNVSSNQLKQISFNINALKKLKVLDLSMNNLKEKFNFELPELKVLRISNNFLQKFPVLSFKKQGKIFENRNQDEEYKRRFEEIEQFNNEKKTKGIGIEEIDLSFNKITKISSKIGAFQSLKKLQLKGNQICSMSDALFNLESLENLNVCKNYIRDPLFNRFKDLRNLKDLNLSFNKIELIDTREINISLERLNLEENKIVNMDRIVFFVALVSLDLASNKIEKIPKKIEQMNNLKYLKLSNNRISEIPPELFSLKELLHLNLARNAIQKIPASIRNLKKVEELNFFGNQIEKIPGKSFGALANVRILNLGHNRIKTIPFTFCSSSITTKNTKNKTLYSKLFSKKLERLMINENQLQYIPYQILLYFAKEQKEYESIFKRDEKNLFLFSGNPFLKKTRKFYFIKNKEDTLKNDLLWHINKEKIDIQPFIVGLNALNVSEDSFLFDSMTCRSCNDTIVGKNDLVVGINFLFDPQTKITIPSAYPFCVKPSCQKRLGIFKPGRAPIPPNYQHNQKNVMNIGHHHKRRECRLNDRDVEELINIMYNDRQESVIFQESINYQDIRGKRILADSWIEHKKRIKRQYNIKSEFLESEKNEIKSQNRNIPSKWRNPFEVIVREVEPNKKINSNSIRFVLNTDLKENNSSIREEGKKDYFCSTCNIQFPDLYAFEEHSNSKEHLMKKNSEYLNLQLEKITTEKNQETVTSLKPYYCKVCNVQTCGPDNFNDHLLGKKHKEMISLSKKEYTCHKCIGKDGKTALKMIGIKQFRSHMKSAHGIRIFANETERKNAQYHQRRMGYKLRGYNKHYRGNQRHNFTNSTNKGNVMKRGNRGNMKNRNIHHTNFQNRSLNNYEGNSNFEKRNHQTKKFSNDRNYNNMRNNYRGGNTRRPNNRRDIPSLNNSNEEKNRNNQNTHFNRTSSNGMNPQSHEYHSRNRRNDNNYHKNQRNFNKNPYHQRNQGNRGNRMARNFTRGNFHHQHRYKFGGSKKNFQDSFNRETYQKKYGKNQTSVGVSSSSDRDFKISQYIKSQNVN